jgi:hypothetical protein
LNYGKAFIAGIAVPATVSPFVIGAFVLRGNVEALAQLPFLYFGSLLWGVWNIIFLLTRKKVPGKERTNKIGFYGAAYGLISALLNGLYFEFTTVLSIADGWIPVAVVVYPLILFLVWKYWVDELNVKLGVY